MKFKNILIFMMIMPVLVAVYGLYSVYSINSVLNNIVNQDVEKVKLAARVQQNIIEMHRAEKNMILAITQKDMKEYKGNFDQAKSEIEKRIDKLNNLVDDANKKKLKLFKKDYQDYIKSFNKVYELTLENSNQKAKVLLREDARDKLLIVDKLIDSLRAEIQKDINDELEKKKTENSVVKQKLKALELISAIESDMLKSVRDTGRAILLLKDEEIKDMAQRSNKFLRNLYKESEKLKKVTDKNNKIDKLINQIRQYDEVQTNILNLTMQNSNQKALDISSTTAKEEIVNARENMTNIVNTVEKELENKSLETDSQYHKTIAFNIGIIILSILISTFLIKNLLKIIKTNMKELESGINYIANSSSQISDSSTKLAETTQEQAASVEEISANLEETESNVRQNLENAQNAENISIITDENATVGHNKIQELSNSMDKISQSSSNIANIIKTIDEIAFQTNLLALNAAVEAARAGEHGLGFAVVSEEVRNLAQRSAESAKQTEDIINESIEHVEKGKNMTVQTNESFQTILENIKEVKLISTEISASSKEQSTGITQITTAMTQINDAIQSIAGHSEETSAVSEETDSQVQIIKQTVQEVATALNVKLD
jgi:methyl-accepting chemotaxis protein